MNRYQIGVDIGSTTMKVVVLNEAGEKVFTDYRRHQANIPATAREMAEALYHHCGNCNLQLGITGSVGMGYAEKNGLSFVQEVVAAAAYIRRHHPEVRCLVDMGGEDSKMIFMEPGKVPDIRMNGSCAGGTGAFIDQVATLLNITPVELSRLAETAETVYPIASRCGVFSKTDIQNLIARNVSKNDIAASVFHAVALQVVAALARGTDIRPQVFFCGGPFAFLPSLKKSFVQVLGLQQRDCILPENAQYVPAIGCALLADQQATTPIELRALLHQLRSAKDTTTSSYADRLPALFSEDCPYEQWLTRKTQYLVERGASACDGPCFLGVDSGSTTTKLVLLNEQGSLVYQDYRRNAGNSLQTFTQALQEMYARLGELTIAGTAVTGYGENLLQAAYNLQLGMVETIAHYMAARQIRPEVSFVLDIGGQDMKAIFIDHGSIQRIEINEACSSGCGSFIETFARMLGYSVPEFAAMACRAQHPCDLGTRCTVFMNSKVKQSLREGAAVEDIAAGFSYSVIKNCLFKVLKLKNTKDLGVSIVVQGGTFKNHSIVRALEVLTGCEVSFSDIPELMGAYGAALYALQAAKSKPLPVRRLSELTQVRPYTTSTDLCAGCENRCTVKSFHFANGNTFFSGNNCERVYSNRSETQRRGVNLYAEKYRILFHRVGKRGSRRIGIPRGLGIYENYPFWHSLFTACGFEVELSRPSTDKLYASGVRSIMADNICFPAKLMHGHVMDLVEKRVERIFYPYVVYEQKEDEQAQNSFNCPVVTGYSDVLKSAIATAEKYGIPLDAPVITFNDSALLRASCGAYLRTLGVDKRTARCAIQQALQAQQDYLETVRTRCGEVLSKARAEHRMVILLAGRPYHIDPYIEHKVSHAIADMGIDVITENVAVQAGSAIYEELTTVSQWAYPNRIFKAAGFVAQSSDNVHYVELTSFGCGPDAFIIDEVSNLLRRYHKNLTLLKIDDVNNIGSLRLRIRSLVESLRFVTPAPALRLEPTRPQRTRVYREEDRRRTILAPYFAEGYSEFLPHIFGLLGYRFINLPMGNQSAADTGLKFANNEICYPSTIVIGTIIQALQSGQYPPGETAIIITQTGGQCRASNYLTLIKNAMVSAGFAEVPVLSLEIGGGLDNNQPGFHFDWKKVLRITLHAMLFMDCLRKMYYACVVRETVPGMARQLLQHYTEEACTCVDKNSPKALQRLLEQAVTEFTRYTHPNYPVPIIGVVGEIYVKYNSFSHQYVIDWLVEQGIEVVSPSLYNFFAQTLVNQHINKDKFIQKTSMPLWMNDLIYHYIRRMVRSYDRICRDFPYYRPFSDIFRDEQQAARLVNTAANFGEGWLIPSELTNLAALGVQNVISMQPFGCIANHVISKGIENKVKRLFPQMSLLFLDFDSGTSQANVYNRLHFMVENCKRAME